MNNSFKKSMVAAVAALFGITACNLSGNNSQEASPHVSSIYNASSTNSDYMKASLSNLSVTPDNTIRISDVYILNGDEVSSLTDEQIILLIKTCLAGKSVLFDNPAVSSIEALGEKITYALNEDENLSAQALLSPYSVNGMISKMTDAAGESSINDDGHAFEAIGFRQNQIYYVHDVSDIYSTTSTDMDETGTAEKEAEGFAISDSPAYLIDSSSPDYTELLNQSVKNFVKWINNTNVKKANCRSVNAACLSPSERTTLGSAIDDLKTAQTFYHNFTASFTHSTTEHYDGRFNGKSESVEVVTDVWAACKIDAETPADYYLVRNSITCNNQQLGYKNDWDNSKNTGPFFVSCYTETMIDQTNQYVRTGDCSPQNSTGSTSYTSGTSFSISGNIGANATGPMGGITGGWTFTESSTRSIPDLSVEFQKNSDNSPEWSYTSPKFTPYWSGLYTHCDDPKAVQTRSATFDTYSVLTLPAAVSYTDEYVRLRSVVQVKLSAINGWLSGFLDTTLNWTLMYNTTGQCYFDLVKKPNNACREYIMSFTAPDGTSEETKDRLHTVIRQYISDWNDNVNYYGIGTENLNTVAAAYFTTAQNKITTNQNVLKDRGFAGKYTFYIQNVEDGTKVKSFTLEF